MATRHHHATNGGIAHRRASRNAVFQEKMRQMRLPLVPLVQMSTGAVHPAFPATLLNFWLLTEEQLDDLARFYHQKSPGPWSTSYPCPITWKSNFTLEEKRRKIGKFIGLRYVRSEMASGVVYYAPRPSTSARPAPTPRKEYLLIGHDNRGCDTPIRIRIKSEEQIVDEARQARLAEDEEALRRKMPWYL